MNNTEYDDDLVHIDSAHVIVKNYYYPSGRDKRVDVRDIDCIHIKRQSVWNGRFRFSGTGNFRTWFATDYERPIRDKIFIMELKNKWWRVGFTVLDSNQAQQVLRHVGMPIVEEHPTLIRPPHVKGRDSR
jgi:hypothetical protein